MFTPSRKQAEQTAARLLAGHCGLTAWWALRHAGVFDAMVKHKAEKNEGLNPFVHAARANMSPEILEALLQYLAANNLVVFKKDEVHFTPEGQALFDHEDGTLELVRAYQPVLDMAEHMLARLKSYGTNGTTGGVLRKTEYLVESQTRRYSPEVFPAVEELVAKQKLTHLLDLACGSGDLLMRILAKQPQVVGVGISPDAASVRRANDAVAKADLDKRLIAVAAAPLDVLTDTQRTFDRIGISRQLWKDFDCIIAANLFGDLVGKPEEIARILAAFAKAFPGAHLMLIEPVDSPKFQRNYYAPEMALLLRLARSSPLSPDIWRNHFETANLKLVQEVQLTTEGLAIFLCRAAPRPAPVHQPSRAMTPR